METLDALVQAKLDGDSEFQATISKLSDQEKADAISKKRSEIAQAEFASIGEKARKEEEVARNYKTRAEKAEQEAKKFKKENGGGKESEDDATLSSDDVLVLVDAKIPREDIGEVQKAAKILNKSIAEALKDSTVQAILKDRAETRRTANAMNTDPARPGAKKPSDAELLKGLSKGEVPKAGSDEAEDLFWARRGGRPKS